MTAQHRHTVDARSVLEGNINGYQAGSSSEVLSQGLPLGSGRHGNSQQQQGNLGNIRALCLWVKGKGPSLATPGKECGGREGRVGVTLKVLTRTPSHL